MDTTMLMGYARCSTDEQDLTAQCQALLDMGVPAERIYTDHGLTGTNRNPPGLDQALAAVRAGETLVVPKLDRLARSVPDARAIGDSLVARGVKLRVGAIVYDPADPMGKMFFNILATFAEFEVDLLRLRTEKAWPSTSPSYEYALANRSASRPACSGVEALVRTSNGKPGSENKPVVLRCIDHRPAGPLAACDGVLRVVAAVSRATTSSFLPMVSTRSAPLPTATRKDSYWER